MDAMLCTSATVCRHAVSVRPSVCPSRSCILSKRVVDHHPQTSSNFLHRRIQPHRSVFYLAVFRRGPPNGGVECRWGMKNSLFLTDISLHRVLSTVWPATEASWVVSYGGKTIPRWRMAAIFKIVILPYFSEKSSDFDEILYTAADFELDERHVIKNEKKLHWTDSEFDRTQLVYQFSLLLNLPTCVSLSLFSPLATLVRPLLSPFLDHLHLL